MRVYLTCPECGTTFSDTPAHAASRVFCSKRCKDLAWIGQRIPLETRFWAKVKKTESCWLWLGARRPGSYGLIGSEVGKASMLLAHRVSWEINVGPIPDGMFVCHNCPGGDNRACVNPAHLFLGTQLANMQDAASKGRTAKGETHGHTTITAVDVLAIRARHAAGGVTYRDVAREYLISRETVGRIIRRETWRDVT